MRKILYSPGYGAGYVSWNSSLPRKVQQFMLEYIPFVDFLEKGNKFPLENKDIEKHELVLLFYKDLRLNFPELWDEDEAPYICLIGLSDLKVQEVPDNCLVMIHEYDGSESVRTKESIEDQWL